MTERKQIWLSDWADRIESRVHALGYSNLTELLGDMPGQPYGIVAERLGNVAPIQVISLQFRDARLSGRIRDAAKDSLVRNLNQQLPHGWGIGKNADWLSVRALSSWSSELQVTGGCEELKPTLLAIAQTLRELPPPDGWIPSSPHDPIIESVFDSNWN